MRIRGAITSSWLTFHSLFRSCCQLDLLEGEKTTSIRSVESVVVRDIEMVDYIHVVHSAIPIIIATAPILVNTRVTAGVNGKTNLYDI